VQRAGVAIDDVRVYVPAHDLDVEIGGSGGGYVDSAPAGIDCGTGRPACSITSSGEVVLTAHSDADSSFAGFTGCDAAGMTCAVTLDQARSVTATFDLLPHAPLAIADAYTADEELPRVVDAPGVLVNDSDRNDDPLTAELVTGPAHGTLELRPDGSFTYVSERDYHGLDSFTYRASDGDLESEPATVTLDVGPIEDAVDAQDDAFVTAEDTALRVDAPGLLGNDRDPDGDPLTAALESEPEHGSVELSPDGSFVYTPDPDFSGSDSFVYRASDSQPATVTIAVAPVDDAPAPGGVLPATASDVAAISDLELGSRCVRRNAAGRVRVPMSMTLSQPGTVRVRVDRAVGSRGRSSCPRANPVRNQRFRRVATFRPVARVRAASVPREVMLDLRLRPGLYRLTVRVLLEDGRVSPPARRFLRVVG
jgi:hypothetical protein